MNFFRPAEEKAEEGGLLRGVVPVIGEGGGEYIYTVWTGLLKETPLLIGRVGVPSPLLESFVAERGTKAEELPIEEEERVREGRGVGIGAD